MATTIPQTEKVIPTQMEEPKFELNVQGWLRDNITGSIWKLILAIIFIAITALIIRAGYRAEPIELSPRFMAEGEATALGEFILTVTSGRLLTTLIVALWVIGAVAVIYSSGRRRWPGPVRWLKESLYTGFFGALATLALTLILVLSVRGLLGWSVLGASFETDPQVVAETKEQIPGAVWGIIAANTKLFAVGQYPSDLVWRVWLALGVVAVLAVLSTLAWNFGSPLRKLRGAIIWGWLASLVVIYFILAGFTDTGPAREVPTNRWGGFLLTMVLSVVGIVVSSPIGVLLALGRRSQVRGVPYLWLWGAMLLLIYWLPLDAVIPNAWENRYPRLFSWAANNFPTESIDLNIPVLFRDPPIWEVTLPPAFYAIVQAVVVVGLFWIVGRYLQGNLIKMFSIVYIELVRGVPLITVLFMANIMLPIFLPRGLEIDNIVRVAVGIILFSAAYIAENVRGGLQAIPRGQYEAAEAIGLSTAQAMRLIILPQALRAVIPANVGQFITLFKDTSLVAIVGLLDLLRIAQVVVAQPEWLGLQRETYAFVALVYWVFSFAMSNASQRLERKLGVGQY
jgi:general L-amino acid transport system permease protein